MIILDLILTIFISMVILSFLYLIIKITGKIIGKYQYKQYIKTDSYVLNKLSNETKSFSQFVKFKKETKYLENILKFIFN